MNYTSRLCAVFLGLTSVATLALIAAGLSANGVIFVDGKQRFTLTVTEKREGQTVQKITEYLDNSGKLAAKDATTYIATTLEVTDGTLENYQTGSIEKITRLAAGKYRLDYRKHSGGEVASEEVKEKDVMLKGSLLFEYISRNYDAIAGGTKTEFRLLVPSRLETIGFELVKERMETLQGKACILMKLRASSWIIRQFAGDMFFWVDVQAPHAVIQYQGRLTPTDEKGNALNGVVKYR